MAVSLYVVLSYADMPRDFGNALQRTPDFFFHYCWMSTATRLENPEELLNGSISSRKGKNCFKKKNHLFELICNPPAAQYHFVAQNKE